MTLDDIMTPLTVDEATTSLYEILEELGCSTTGWKPGSVVRAIISLTAILLTACSVLIVALARGGYRHTATGAWLKLHATDFYGVTPVDATFAAGTLTLSNAAGGVYDKAALSCVFQNSTSKKTYRNSAAFHLGSGTLGSPTTVDIAIEAVESGSASTSAAGEIDTISTAMIGVTCTNAAAVVGLDAESDASLQEREDASIDALSPDGPAGAYLQAAKLATRADGTNIGVTRVKVSDPSSVGVVTVTVATATGGVTGSASNEGDDLWYVDQKIQSLAVPLGITATTRSASAVTETITYALDIYLTDSRDDDTIKLAISNALAAWFAQRPIGGDNGKLYKDTIRGVIWGACTVDNKNYVYRAVLSVPSTDITLTDTQVAMLETISATINWVNP